MNTNTATARAVESFWQHLPAPILAAKRQAIRQQVQIMSRRPWARSGALNRHYKNHMENWRQMVDDCTDLWDLAAGVNDTTRLEWLIWRETLNGLEPDAQQALIISVAMHRVRQRVLASFIFHACETLPADALDFAWRWEIWAQPPIVETHQTAARMHATVYGQPNIWERIERSAPAPRYPQDMHKADDMLCALRAGQLQTGGKRQRNDTGADLIRAAAYFWQLTESLSAAAMLRAFQDPSLAPDEKSAELLTAAREVFSKPPSTDRAILNYLRD